MPTPDTEKETGLPPQDGAVRRENHQEELIDEAIEETFPASDPISPSHVA